MNEVAYNNVKQTSLFPTKYELKSKLQQFATVVEGIGNTCETDLKVAAGSAQASQI